MTTCGIIKELKSYFKGNTMSKLARLNRECFFAELEAMRYYKAQGIDKGERSVWHLIYWQGIRAARDADFKVYCQDNNMPTF